MKIGAKSANLKDIELLMKCNFTLHFDACGFKIEHQR